MVIHRRHNLDATRDLLVRHDDRIRPQGLLDLRQSSAHILGKKPLNLHLITSGFLLLLPDCTDDTDLFIIGNFLVGEDSQPRN